MGPMGWSRAEYLAVMSGRADEAARERFVQALRDRDPELEAILAERRRRSIEMFQTLPGVRLKTGLPGAAPQN
jgi:hypothetical protein